MEMIWVQICELVIHICHAAAEDVESLVSPAIPYGIWGT
jgi:hypothetical protein